MHRISLKVHERGKLDWLLFSGMGRLWISRMTTWAAQPRQAKRMQLHMLRKTRLAATGLR